MSVGFLEIVFASNARTTLEEMCFDDIMRCVEKWRVYNEQTVKQ